MPVEVSADAARDAGVLAAASRGSQADSALASRALKDAKRRLDEELWTEQRANEAREAYRARGVGRTGRRFSPAATPKPYTPPATPGGQVNITDHDSRLVKGRRGWIQGYKAQAVCNEQHLIVAAEVMTASPDFGHLGPMLAAARRERPAPESASHPTLSWPTPATGTSSRTTRSPATASRS
jgi:hypothetical protein